MLDTVLLGVNPEAALAAAVILLALAGGVTITVLAANGKVRPPRMDPFRDDWRGGKF